MKMVKLNLAEYFIQGRVLNPETNISEVKNLPYNVKQSIAGLLFHPDLRLTMKNALDRKELSDSIENCKEDSILVTETDFAKIRESFDKVQGFGKNDIELLERISKAETVETEILEKK